MKKYILTQEYRDAKRKWEGTKIELDAAKQKESSAWKRLMKLELELIFEENEND